jgi:hypothetical protein
MERGFAGPLGQGLPDLLWNTCTGEMFRDVGDFAQSPQLKKVPKGALSIYSGAVCIYIAGALEYRGEGPRGGCCAHLTPERRTPLRATFICCSISSFIARSSFIA